LDIVTVDSNMP